MFKRQEKFYSERLSRARGGIQRLDAEENWDSGKHIWEELFIDTCEKKKKGDKREA